MQFLNAGDQAVVVEFGSVIDPDVNALVHRTAAAIDESEIDGVLEMVPTYRSLLIYYDPLQVSLPELQNDISGLAIGDAETSDEYRIVEIPTLYGGEYGPDLEFVARNCGYDRVRSNRDALRHGLSSLHDGIQSWISISRRAEPKAEHAQASVAANSDPSRIRRDRRDSDGCVPGG